MGKDNLWWRSWRWAKQGVIEALFRNVGIPYRNLLSLLLGFIAPILLLSTNTVSNATVASTYVGALVVITFLFVFRPYIEKEIDRFRWGALVVVVFGFGLGALVYHYRAWGVWLWSQYRRINEPHELLLEGLFLLGVILGFFVVRNWAKDQKDFVSSLSAVLGGAFVSTVLGKLNDKLDPLSSFAYYALGFTLSGVLNLIAAAWLTANYTNKHSITSRSIMDFLYGSERAILIDGYFLRNFKNDPDYAKSSLTDTLLRFRKLVIQRFADRMEQRRKEREAARDALVPSVPNETIDQHRARTIERNRALQGRRRELESSCSELKAKRKELEKGREELKREKATARRQELEVKLQELERQLQELHQQCDEGELKSLQTELGPVKQSFYYQLLSIACEQKKGDSENDEAKVPEMERKYKVTFRRVHEINREMIRVGIAVRWQDTLEYIVAPGQYKQPFPFFRSVAGLALQVQKTIVMDRDKDKKFRSKEYSDGRCPSEIEQLRGLDEIDFLSYVSIPVVSRPGSSTENGVGVVNVDSRLFATTEELRADVVEAKNEIYTTELTRSELTGYANNIFEENDRHVQYLEDLTEIIVPVLELYLKCRQGAT